MDTENSMVVGATEEYERQNGECTDKEMAERYFARKDFAYSVLTGGEHKGKNGLYDFGDVLASMPKPFVDEFHWADDATIFKLFTEGLIPEWAGEFRKQVFIMADTAIGEAL